MAKSHLDHRIGIKDPEIHDPCGLLYKFKPAKGTRGLNAWRKHDHITKEILDRQSDYVVLLSAPEELKIPDPTNDLYQPVQVATVSSDCYLFAFILPLNKLQVTGKKPQESVMFHVLTFDDTAATEPGLLTQCGCGTDAQALRLPSTLFLKMPIFELSYKMLKELDTCIEHRYYVYVLKTTVNALEETSNVSKETANPTQHFVPKTKSPFALEELTNSMGASGETADIKLEELSNRVTSWKKRNTSPVERGRRR